MDPSQDWFLRQLMNLADGIQGIHSQSSKIEIPQPTNAVNSDEILPLILNGMIKSGKIDEAENLLFRCVENYPLVENYTIGLDFYAKLATMDADDLKAAGWSREEIKDGIADLHFLIFDEPLDRKTIFEEE
ncbi:MAG: DUF6483 family protein [Clostridiales bacterium]